MRPLTDYTSVALTNCFLNQVRMMEKDRMEKKNKKKTKKEKASQTCTLIALIILPTSHQITNTELLRAHAA